MKLTAILLTYEGTEHRAQIEVADVTEPPGIITVDNVGQPLRAFYGTGMRERGTAAFYVECRTQKADVELPS